MLASLIRARCISVLPTSCMKRYATLVCITLSQEGSRDSLFKAPLSSVVADGLFGTYKFNIARRVALALEHQHQTFRDCQGIIWSDRFSICLGKLAGRSCALSSPHGRSDHEVLLMHRIYSIATCVAVTMNSESLPTNSKWTAWKIDSKVHYSVTIENTVDKAIVKYWSKAHYQTIVDRTMNLLCRLAADKWAQRSWVAQKFLPARLLIRIGTDIHQSD